MFSECWLLPRSLPFKSLRKCPSLNKSDPGEELLANGLPVIERERKRPETIALLTRPAEPEAEGNTSGSPLVGTSMTKCGSVSGQVEPWIERRTFWVRSFRGYWKKGGQASGPLRVKGEAA